MMFQLLVPGMEHAEEADVGTEMFRIPGDFAQRFSTGPEQQIVDDLLILQGQRGEPTRKREDNMDVARRQEFPAARLKPTVPGVGLTLGTVPIAAGIERDGATSAAGTLIEMTAERGGTATFNVRQDLEVPTGDPLPTLLGEPRSCPADEIGHFQRRPLHLFVSRGLVFLACARQRQRVQRTGGGAEMAARKVEVEGGLFQITVAEQHLDGA